MILPFVLNELLVVTKCYKNDYELYKKIYKIGLNKLIYLYQRIINIELI